MVGAWAAAPIASTLIRPWEEETLVSQCLAAQPLTSAPFKWRPWHLSYVPYSGYGTVCSFVEITYSITLIFLQ